MSLVHSKSHEQPGDMQRFVVVILVDPEMAQTTIKKRSWLVVQVPTLLDTATSIGPPVV
jgi:hypothetical protein